MSSKHKIPPELRDEANNVGLSARGGLTQAYLNYGADAGNDRFHLALQSFLGQTHDGQ